ncbi:MAG: 50S ribosomal protein L28 [Phycisphaeraceae bacterium]|nr:50S ribosomal protein L28 [Phycisphaerales bacterium]MCB9860707.1 50S ribosomal protein L28 [Phycisphaeraceae bacterium]
MGYVCEFTGKKTSFGRKRAWRGAAITKGGFGLKASGIARKRFRPNIQKVTALIDGKPTRVRASTKAIKSGLVVKPLKRKYGYTAQQKAS